MKVSELRKILDNYPPDMEVIVDLYSDYGPVEVHKIIVVAPQDDYYIRYHPTMLPTRKVITALYIG
jgi:hypothetical protein